MTQRNQRLALPTSDFGNGLLVTSSVVVGVLGWVALCLVLLLVMLGVVT
jgi:hypothetical protein